MMPACRTPSGILDNSLCENISLLTQMQGAPVPITAYPKPPHPAPHSYLVLVLLTLAFCLFWNITSLALGIPALIFSVSVSEVHAAIVGILEQRANFFTAISSPHLLVNICQHIKQVEESWAVRKNGPLLHHGQLGLHWAKCYSDTRPDVGSLFEGL